MLIILLSTYNCLLLPVEFAFSPPAFELNWNKALQLCIDVIFFADIPITFRTTYVDYGKEIFNPKKIAERYSKGSLMVDVVSCIPFDNIGMAMKVNDPTTLQLLRLLKLSRLFRLSRIITYLQTYKSLKTTLRLVKLCFFLFLYVHCMACLWFWIVRFDELWMPPLDFIWGWQETPLFGASELSQYWTSFYHSLLYLTSNDLGPRGDYQLMFASFADFAGALMTGLLFGEIAVLFKEINA